MNANAIKTRVDTLAARSATGIYIQEADGVTVGSTAAIAVERSNFNSTTTTFIDSVWQDLETSSGGPIKLQSLLGNIVINDGNANGFGVRASAAGDVLLQTLAQNGDIIVNSDVLSTGGHISFVATDDIHVNVGGDVRTGGSGTIYFSAANQLSDATVGIAMASTSTPRFELTAATFCSAHCKMSAWLGP